MSKVDHVELVSRLVERDKTFVGDFVAREAGHISDSTVADEDLVRLAFSDHFNEHPGPTTNLPHGAAIGPYLLLGGAPVVDLRPDLDETEFYQKHGLNFRDAEELAEKGFIVPNLYWRSPKDWKTAHDGLAGLVSKSFVIGERIDRFLDARYPDHDVFVEDRFRELTDLASRVPTVSKNQSDLRPRQVGENDCRIACIRWGYLNNYAPAASRRAFELMNGGELGELLDHLHLEKWLSCTHITGALGGNFVLGPGNLDLIHRRRSIDTTEAETIRAFMPGRREALEYLWRELAGTVNVAHVAIPDVKNIVGFLEASDNRVLRNEVIRTIDDLTRACIDGNLVESDVESHKKLIQDYEDRIKKYSKIGRRGAIGVGIAEVGIDFATSGFLTVVGVAMSAFGLGDEVVAERNGTALSESLARTYLEKHTPQSIVRAYGMVTKLRAGRTG